MYGHSDEVERYQEEIAKLKKDAIDLQARLDKVEGVFIESLDALQKLRDTAFSGSPDSEDFKLAQRDYWMKRAGLSGKDGDGWE